MMERMEAQNLRVLVVEPDVILRNALNTFLDAMDDLMPVGAAGSAAEAFDLCQTAYPDVILMEIQLPDLNGVEAIRRLRALCPDVPIVALTSAMQGELMHEALMAGATGWLEKWTSADEVAKALRLAVRKGIRQR
jgi:DNA-binding NarL/FixJ family response regulator